MRKTAIVYMVISFLSVSSVWASQGPGHKLYRGIVNIITAPVEIPKQARAYWITGAQKTPHILVWIYSGSVWGVVEGIKRAGSGVWDVISFAWDKPSGFEPLFKPDYVLEDWPRNPKSGR